jgi:hypothetical protein
MAAPARPAEAPRGAARRFRGDAAGILPAMRRCLPLLVLAFASVPAPGQQVGSDAPDIAWQKTFGFGAVPAQKLSELRGSVVLLEFWGTH